jgi:uncharacterized RDD family membrane protein YckC
MAWYYVLGGTSHGPVAEADLRELHAQSAIALDTPVWTDGMAEWLPFSSSPLAAGDASVAIPSIPAGATHTCAHCSQLFPESEMLQYEGSWVCAACKPAFFQRIKEGVTARGAFVYASVLDRFVAVLIDAFVMVGCIFILALPFILTATIVVSSGPPIKTVADEPWFGVFMVILLYGFPPAYEIFMIGKYGATWGKMAVKIKVVRPDGERVSYGRSTGRYFAKIPSAMILYIGFLMAFWDKERRALHDQICQTRVIRIKPS